MDGWKPLATQARIAQVPEPNARRYASAFPQFFPARKLGKALVYGPDTVDVLKVIADAFAQKKTRPEVEEILAVQFTRTHDVEPIPKDAPSPPPGPAVPEGMDLNQVQVVAILDRLATSFERLVDMMDRRLTTLENASGRPQDKPKGYFRPIVHPDQEMPVVDKEALVLEVMRMRAMGYGASRIRTTLVKAGWGSLAGPGHKLSKSTVAKIIKSNGDDAS